MRHPLSANSSRDLRDTRDPRDTREIRNSRLLRPAGLCLLALAALLLICSCGKDKEDKETPVGLIAVYNGPEITVTDHVFDRSDFTVLVSYADGRDVFVSDFEFEQLRMSQGYYIFRFAYHGFEQEAYVKCNAPIFPSDKTGE